MVLSGPMAKTVDDFDVLVYNQDFINDNFVNYGDLKGVFIFGEEDIEAKKKKSLNSLNRKNRKWMLVRPRLMSTKRSQMVSHLH